LCIVRDSIELEMRRAEQRIKSAVLDHRRPRRTAVDGPPPVPP
jgi:hypothetical protein